MWTCYQDGLEKIEYGSNVDQTQQSLDMLQQLKQRTHDLHPEVQSCCSYKVETLIIDHIHWPSINQCFSGQLGRT